MEQRYRDVLKYKDGEIYTYREHNANLMKITELLEARSPMAEVPKYDLRRAQLVGGFSETVQGNMEGGTINNYGARLDEARRLITFLRRVAQSFPSEQKANALMELDDIESDIQYPQPNQQRIGRQLKRLAAIATIAAAITGDAVTFSGDLNDFISNVIDLTDTLGIEFE